MRCLAVCAALLAGGSLPVAAGPSLECSLRSSSQVETADCLAALEDIVNEALDVFVGYARVAAEELDTVTERPVATPAFEASQSTWETYRDAQCDYRGALFGGGSGTGIEIRSCRIEMTRTRIEALKGTLR